MRPGSAIQDIFATFKSKLTACFRFDVIREEGGKLACLILVNDRASVLSNE